jgi:transcriptional regulator with XRE-family HTH domain
VSENHRKETKMTNTFQLEVEIKRNGLTKKQVAEKIGLTEQGLQLKINNKTEFKASEIQKLCDLLHLKDKSIFFEKNSE